MWKTHDVKMAKAYLTEHDEDKSNNLPDDTHYEYIYNPNDKQLCNHPVMRGSSSFTPLSLRSTRFGCTYRPLPHDNQELGTGRRT